MHTLDVKSLVRGRKDAEIQLARDDYTLMSVVRAMGDDRAVLREAASWMTLKTRAATGRWMDVGGGAGTRGRARAGASASVGASDGASIESGSAIAMGDRGSSVGADADVGNCRAVFARATRHRSGSGCKQEHIAATAAATSTALTIAGAGTETDTTICAPLNGGDLDLMLGTFTGRVCRVCYNFECSIHGVAHVRAGERALPTTAKAAANDRCVCQCVFYFGLRM